MPNRIVARFTALLLVLLVLPALTFAQTGPFVNLAANPVGKVPAGVAIGDINGDGRPDLAVANDLSNTVSILLGNGDGSYQPAKTISVGNNPQHPVLADVNNDGKADLIVGNLGDQTIEVLIGNGDGTFQPPTVYSLGGLPNAIVIGDFTGDGIPDLVVASEVPSTFGGVQIFVGKGDGTFQPSSGLVGYAAGSGPIALVAGDFDGSGSLDLAVSLDSSQIDILLNDSNGNFTSKGKISVDSPVSLAVGDFNGDSRLDLAVVSNGTNQVSILIGFGDGTFNFLSPTSIQVGLNPRSIVAGDLNGDGKVDLVVSNAASNTLSVLLGNGDGTFLGVVNYPTLSGPFGLAIADVNHDGRPDVVVTETTQNTAQVFLSNGDGTLRTGTYPAGTTLTSITSGDFNGDGNPDFAIVGNGTVSIFLGDGHGGFKAAGSFTDGVSNTVAESIVAGDFNNDGKIDLVVGSNGAHFDAQSLQIFLGNGDGTFQPTQGVGTYAQGNLLAFDFNGDGNLDVVSPLGTGGVEVDLGVGTGAPGRVENAVAPAGVGVAVGDFNGDGKLDLAVVTESSVVEVFLGNGDGAFLSGIATQVSQLSRVNCVTAGDFNGDGILDLAVGVIASGGAGIDPAGSSGPVVILAGKGDGTFQELPGVVTETGTLTAVSDFNGDGIPDLAISRADTGSVDVMQGKGDGTFIKMAEYPVGADSGALVVADFNLDGAPDLAVVNSGSVVVLMNASTKGLDALTTTQLSFSPPAVVGEQLELTASVTGKNGLPTGTVTFKEDGIAFATGAVASGQGQATSPTLTLGARSFIALYTGDANFNGSLSTRLVINVGPASSTTTLKASTAAKLGEPVIFTATVTPQFSGTPTGTIQFFADGQPAGAASLSGGQATFSTSSLSLGTHKIEANYSGDQDFTASVATLSEKIGKGVSTVAIISSANPSAFGQPVTLTATVTDSEGTIPTGQLVFQDSTTVYGILTLTGGTAQVSISTLTAGTHKITAQYEGDSSNSTASASIQQVINGIPTATSVATSVQPSTFGKAVTFTATVTSGSGMPDGTVTFKNGSSVLATVPLTSGSAQVVASTLNVGTRTVTAIYSGSNTFAASTGTTLQIVEKVATATTLTSSLNPSPAGQSITLTAVVTSSAAEEATGNVTFKDGKTVLGTAALVNGQAQLNTSLLTTGTHNITAAFGGNSNFVGSNAAITQVIE